VDEHRDTARERDLHRRRDGERHDGALSLARGLVATLPQIDRRIVVLSDLADKTVKVSLIRAGQKLELDVLVGTRS